MTLGGSNRSGDRRAGGWFVTQELRHSAQGRSEGDRDGFLPEAAATHTAQPLSLGRGWRT